MTIQLIFWSALSFLFYSYLGYGLTIYTINKLHKSKKQSYNKDYKPSISFIIPAYNEQEFIREKIKNTLSLEYPADLLKIVVVSDGSTDNTNTILSDYPQVETFFIPERRGKVAAMNRVMRYIETDITIFSDANTSLNTEALTELTKHYQNETVGAVSGEKVVLNVTGEDVSNNESLYWKYESFLKKQDADFYSLIGSAGELFSIRTKLFEPIEEDIILDDFMLSLNINLKGYIVQYEPNAKAMELPSDSIKEERKRKIRISAGAFQAMSRLPELWNIFKTPKLSFLYLSHRVSRWTIAPLCLVVIYISNALLATQEGIYLLLFLMQNLFYLAALLGSIFTLKAFQIPFYFLFMNVSLVQGFIRFMKKEQPAAWERAKRLHYQS